jgi:hypothetical protein
MVSRDSVLIEGFLVEGVKGCSGAHQASYSMYTVEVGGGGCPFPRVNLPETKIHTSSPFSVGVKNAYSCNSILQCGVYSCMTSLFAPPC